MLVHLKECRKYVYPDIMILCQKPELDVRNGIDVLLNPEIIIEVLSASTELYDRTRKFECYKTLSSFRQYILIDSQTYLVETYDKTPENHWLQRTETNLDSRVVIAECEVFLKDIYDLISFV